MAWDTHTTGITTHLQDIDMDGEDYGVIVGDRRTVLIFDGEVWMESPDVGDSGLTPGARLEAVTVLSPNDVWIGTMGSRDDDSERGVSHWNGTTWWMLDRAGPNSDRIFALWNDGEGTVFSGRSNGRITRYDGADWERYLSEEAGMFRAIHGLPGGGTIWAVGTSGPQGIYTSPDGGFTWEEMDDPALGAGGWRWNDVWIFEDETAWLVGEDGAAAFWDGETFQLADFAETDLNGIHAFAPDDVWVVGDRGLVFHYNGSRWQEVRFRPGTGAALNAITADASGRLWIVGNQGAVYSGTRR